MNSITIAGIIGRDAEVRFMPNGDPVCSFSVADSQGKDKPTIWWTAQLFGKRAESLAPYLTKGQAVTIAGVVTQRAYKDKNGQERTAQDIRVGELALQGGRREGTTATKTPDGQTAHVRKASTGFDDMDEDSIPF